METVDSSNKLSDRKSGMVVSAVLKTEIIIAVVWFFELSFGLAIALGAACVFINQLTEICYFKAQTQRQKLLILLKSLLVTSFFYLAAYLIHVDFIYHRHGEMRFDTDKILLVAKLVVVVFVLLSAVRLLAVGCDWLVNRHEQNKKAKDESLKIFRMTAPLK